ncbi:MAG: MarR family winged helix-turn-helix transcriptional regulator [Trueperaceae bacterium]|nr:MarR family winged helix-turn-helix transcriptional regulator [Trueperaceae bacterium]
MTRNDESDAVRVYRRGLQVHRRLARLVDETFVRELEHTTTELLVLRSAVLGYTSPSAIARRLGLQAPTVARCLATLQAGGLVTVDDDRHDRRRRIAQPTPAGFALDARAEGVIDATFAQHFPHADRGTLHRAAQALDALWGCIGSDEGYPDDPERPAAAAAT